MNLLLRDELNPACLPALALQAYVYDSSPASLYVPSSYTYTVRVHTSDESGADFDGDVCIKLANWW